MGVAYVIALGLSSLALLTMAATRFGTNSTTDRIVCGVIGLLLGWFLIHLLFFYEGGAFAFSVLPFIIPIVVTYKLFRGFRNRKKDRAQRKAHKENMAAAEEWRATRRF